MLLHRFQQSYCKKLRNMQRLIWVSRLTRRLLLYRHILMTLNVKPLKMPVKLPDLMFCVLSTNQLPLLWPMVWTRTPAEQLQFMTWAAVHLIFLFWKSVTVYLRLSPQTVIHSSVVKTLTNALLTIWLMNLRKKAVLI